MSYHAEYQASIQSPATFWAKQAERLAWFRAPQAVLTSDDNGIYRWFADGLMNTAYMALDHHIETGRGEQLALIYDSPVTGVKQQYSYRQLRDEVALLAGVLKAQGVEKGDRVIIYMPMIPQAVMAMLAVARLGAIHSVVFGGFAANELAMRIDDARPKLVLSASCGIEVNKLIAYKPILDKAIELATHQPLSCVILQRPQLEASLQAGRDLDWQQALQKAEPAACEPVLGSDPLYILYTSGTTGKPKGVVRDNGGHAVALHYSMQAIYNMQPGEVFWAASDVGWVVGHSYIVYGPLLAGCTTLLYEGKPVRTPDPGAFWRVVEEYGVQVLFAAPTAFRAIRKEDADARFLEKYDIGSLKAIYMAGERLDPPTYEWTTHHTGKPVVDHWWQTETGWPICANPMGLEPTPPKPGSATLPVPGFHVQVLDEQGQPVAPGTQGAIAIKLPLPPGCLPTIWGDVQRFKEGYLSDYPGYYNSGDGGYLDKDGYLFVMGRTDDVINVAGHRLSTGEMEEVVAAHPAVAECAVIGVTCPIKGQVPVGLVLLKDGQDMQDAQLESELVAKVRAEIGALACFQRALKVQKLPKTRSGKILRKLLRQMAAGQEYSLPSTIEDPDSIVQIERVMREQGLIASAL